MQTFVSELRRITLLWDELWLGTLNQHHTELNRRLTQLEQEVIRVENNSSLTNFEKIALIAEKHRIILKPVRHLTPTHLSSPDLLIIVYTICIPFIFYANFYFLYFQVVFILEQLHSITSVPPQTPHETWFQEKFGSSIKIALEKLKNPADPRKPMESWHSFKAVHAKLQKVKNISRKNCCLIYKKKKKKVFKILLTLTNSFRKELVLL